MSSTGARFEGRDDVFLLQLIDARSGRTLDAMTNAQRRSALEATGSLRFIGPQVTASSGALLNGVDTLGRVEVYAPAFAQNGSTASHWSNEVAPLELMAPFFEVPLHDPGLAVAALGDLGWELAGAPGCFGDCDGGGSVTIDELVVAVRIALGEAEVAACTAVDSGGDGSVSIADLVAAMNSALAGCR